MDRAVLMALLVKTLMLLLLPVEMLVVHQLLMLVMVEMVVKVVLVVLLVRLLR